MASYLITPNDVKDFCGSASGLSDTAINRYIAYINQADQCLTSNDVPCDIGQFLKLSAICHYMTRKFGGQVKSQRDFEGASISFAHYETTGYGLSSTTFGQDINSSPYSDCFDFLNRKPNRFIQTVGRSCE